MRVHLVAVQAEIRTEAYRTADAFRDRVLDLVRGAVNGIPEDQPRVVAFPEAFAVPLLFWLGTPEAVVAQPSMAGAAWSLLKNDWREVVRHGIRRRSVTPALLYQVRALEVWPVYERVFCEAARIARAYLVSGSLFSPLIDWEPTRGFHARERKAYNLCMVLSPRGTVLSRVPKRRLTEAEERGFLHGATWGEHVVNTAIGRIATLICFDAFHESLVEEVDSQGAWLLVQPSANAGRWDGPWSADARQIEGEVWLREGLAKKLGGRENLRYGINPMLNGSLYDLLFEGRSCVAEAGGFLSLADRPTGDAILRSEVEIDPARWS